MTIALRTLVVLLAAGIAALPASAQTGATPGEWHYYGGDSGNTKYSQLDQINRDNVQDLEIAWRWKSDNFGTTPQFLYEPTPLMIDGVLYTTAGNRRAVVAIDTGTGETLWMYRLDEGQRGENAPRRSAGRGVAYWTDGTADNDGRIFLITPGYHLVSLDPKTGRPDPGFGSGGIVDLKQGLDRPVDPVETNVGSSSPPIVVGDVVVVGAALLPGSAPRSRENAPGFIRGYDVRTGERLWIFHTIPVPGEFGNETWEDGSWRYTGNTGAWTVLAADQELGYVYIPVEDATGDYYGGHRLGDNLFSSSIVCLDAKTGRRVWHYQLVHHDVWDYDPASPPILLDVTVEGRPRKLVVQITKQAFAYVFDRVTGEPIWPIVERPVAASDVPGERTAPTQPFPTKPAPFDLQGITTDDLIDITRQLRAEALEIASQYRLGPLFTPPARAENPDGTKGMIMSPGSGGGANWDSGAADIETGVIYVTSQTSLSMRALAPNPGSDMNFVTRQADAEGPRGFPLTKPPWGRITAIDLKTGDHLWMVPNGDTPDEVKNLPELQGRTIPNTGKSVRGGTLVTKTLLFAGAAEPNVLYGEPLIRAYDKATGARIATIDLPAMAMGVPMTYLHNGKQYIVVAVGGRNHPGELVALTLP